jgi:rhamnulokinase
MTTSSNLLAIDLGAESGRAILGRLTDNHLQLSEVHRFPNTPILLPNGRHWDILHLFSNVKDSIRAGKTAADGDVESVGLDTWGVDYGLLDHRDALLGIPYHYRDSRTEGMLDEIFKIIPREQIYKRTGIQFMALNSLVQLFSMVYHKAPAIHAASTFLTTPDLLNFWLTGQKVSEFTIATTTQCYNPQIGNWAFDILDKLGIPKSIFKPVVPPGTNLGPLLPEVAAEVGVDKLKVIAPACHDTGSAVLAVPAMNPQFAYISSGTWSLVGMEIDQPLINNQTLGLNFTNEGGAGGKIRFLKDVSGLWLVQESRRQWQIEGKSFSYGDLTEMAGKVEPCKFILDPDDPTFVAPGDMPNRIREFCRRTGQVIPQTEGEIIRSALDSLALKYKWVISCLEDLFGIRLEAIHIVGGGSQNRLLNQLTADATGLTVIAGPVEATAIGNLLVQAIALGQLSSIWEARQVVRDSFTLETFYPQNNTDWDEPYHRMLQMGEH